MFKVGQRIRLVRMADDPDPIPPGMEGTIEHVNEVRAFTPAFTQLSVKWDNGRTLMPCIPPDSVQIISPPVRTSATCVECGRVFDLTDATDAEEWSVGHDCEA